MSAQLTVDPQALNRSFVDGLYDDLQVKRDDLVWEEEKQTRAKIKHTERTSMYISTPRRQECNWQINLSIWLFWTEKLKPFRVAVKTAEKAIEKLGLKGEQQSESSQVVKTNGVFSVDVEQLLLLQVPVPHFVLPNATSELQALSNSMLGGDVVDPSSRHDSDTSSQLSGLPVLSPTVKRVLKITVRDLLLSSLAVLIRWPLWLATVVPKGSNKGRHRHYSITTLQGWTILSDDDKKILVATKVFIEDFSAFVAWMKGIHFYMLVFQLLPLQIEMTQMWIVIWSQNMT
jgi:hypothetical protein